jgi:hypothetical protein
VLAGWVEEPLEIRWIQETHGTCGIRCLKESPSCAQLRVAIGVFGLMESGGEPHSVCPYRRRSTLGVASFVRMALLAAAPLNVWHAARRTTSHGLARFRASRCGTRKTLLQISGWARTAALHVKCNAPPFGLRYSARPGRASPGTAQVNVAPVLPTPPVYAPSMAAQLE